MALSTQTQAACLLLLLLASLSSSTLLQQQVSTPGPLLWESQVPGWQDSSEVMAAAEGTRMVLSGRAKA